MKIAVNTRHLTGKGFDGTGRFTYETFKIITQEHPGVEFLFLFDRKYEAEFIFSKNITPLVVYPPTRHPKLIEFWYNYSLPYIFKKHKPDLFVSPDGLLSLRTGIRQLAVIHDLNFIHFRDNSSGYWEFFSKFYPRSAAAANRIATVSEFSKKDIVKNYHIAGDNIDVVYNGASSIYIPADDKTKAAIKQQYVQGCDYFVFAGSMYERKNIYRLLQAFEKYKTENNNSLKMIFAGSKKWMSTEVESLVNKMKYKNDVVFTGRLSDEEMRKVLGSAIALTYVSLFEGFGIPVLEAMYCDIPVITSQVSSMPEVAGEAALYVNPLSVDEITLAMKRIADNKNFRGELIEKGRIQRKLFSWKKSADLLWQSIEKCF